MLITTKKDAKMKKYLKKFLFNRITFIFLAVSLQLLLIVGITEEFREFFVVFYWFNLVAGMVTVLWVINKNSNPTYKIAWIILILAFPLFGVLFYIFYEKNKLNKKTMSGMKSSISKMREALTSKQAILDELVLENETAANQSKYILNSADCPVYDNTTSEYLSSGEKMFVKLKQELQKAEHYIFLEYFIIHEGIMWNSILDILAEKASQGVDVRVIYDDVGCLFTLPYGYDKKLEEMGIKCCVFSPLVPVLSPKINNRDHRKIAVIDGHTGFTGGINLADEYINEIERFGHWKDTAIMLKGEAVWSLTIMFLSMWGLYQRNQ